jgi:UDP-glucuronate 4-epimerase
MNYLVTGGSGFIVHILEHLLKDGHFVINIDNFDDFYDYQIKIKNTLESVNNLLILILQIKKMTFKT